MGWLCLRPLLLLVRLLLMVGATRNLSRWLSFQAAPEHTT